MIKKRSGGGGWSFLGRALQAELTVSGDRIVEEGQGTSQLPIVQNLLMVLTAQGEGPYSSTNKNLSQKKDNQ